MQTSSTRRSLVHRAGAVAFTSTTASVLPKVARAHHHVHEVRYRDGLRLCPHIYNTRRHISRVWEGVASMRDPSQDLIASKMR